MTDDYYPPRQYEEQSSPASGSPDRQHDQVNPTSAPRLDFDNHDEIMLAMKAGCLE